MGTKIFSEIYKSHSWGSRSKSGPGSVLEFLDDYGQCLQSYIDRTEVRTVVDLGCGDWTLGKALNLKDVKYLGLDIVPELIDEHKVKYSTNNIQFRTFDANNNGLPNGDLLIVKDVLQHWPSCHVHNFLNALPCTSFKYALITNDVARYHAHRFSIFRWRSKESFGGHDPEFGGYRPIDLRWKPYFFNAKPILEFEVRHDGCIDLKQTLLWENPKLA